MSCPYCSKSFLPPKKTLAPHNDCPACIQFLDGGPCRQCVKDFLDKGDDYDLFHEVMNTPSLISAIDDEPQQLYNRLVMVAVSIDPNTIDFANHVSDSVHRQLVEAKVTADPESFKTIDGDSMTPLSYGNIALSAVKARPWLIKYVDSYRCENYAEIAFAAVNQFGQLIQHVKCLSSNEYAKAAMLAVRDDEHAFEYVAARKLDDKDYCRVINAAIACGRCVWPYVVESKLDDDLRAKYAYAKQLNSSPSRQSDISNQINHAHVSICTATPPKAHAPSQPMPKRSTSSPRKPATVHKPSRGTIHDRRTSF